MHKTILITGATDGIGFETAKMLAADGHHLLVHGRNPDKLRHAQATLSALSDDARIETFLADLSHMSDVKALAVAVTQKHPHLEALINNAGVYTAADPRTDDGLDVRFAVNTYAPYLLTRLLLPLIGASGRVVNLSSAAQAPVDLQALAGKGQLGDGAAYAQSKLALTMWSRSLGLELSQTGPAIIAVNPGSMLGSNMVRQAFGVAGGDLRIGADILVRAALSEEFASATGTYFDNDSGAFAAPHPDALDPNKCAEIIRIIEAVLADLPNTNGEIQ